MKRKNLTAQELIDFVHNSTPSTPENYPALLQLSGQPRETFLVGHGVRHLSQSVGKMQGVLETAEHCDKLDKEELTKEIFAASFSICKLCALLDISGNDLIGGVYQLAQNEKEISI